MKEKLRQDLLDYGFKQNETSEDCYEVKIKGTKLIYRTNIRTETILLVTESKYIGNSLKPQIPKFDLNCILLNFAFITGYHLQLMSLNS